MNTVMLGFIAETPIHCGAGRSTGIIDLPVAREAATDIPFIPGSGLKGSLKDKALTMKKNDSEWESVVEKAFGKADNAGSLLISDVRMLLLPVRSLQGTYRWLTCPMILERYARDLARCRSLIKMPEVGLPCDNNVRYVLANQVNDDRLWLEEYEFVVNGPIPDEVVKAVAPLIRHEAARRRLANQLAIVNNDDFTMFCRYAVPVQVRNQLDPKSKTSKNLWYEEHLPVDTVMHALVTNRDEESKEWNNQLFPDEDPYIQVGGNETVGHGWMAITIIPGGGEA